ncbi:MAG TPA: hypothetical protein VKV57_11905 [bacterium]|nr:hypothetical protein [bacterium]
MNKHADTRIWQSVLLAGLLILGIAAPVVGFLTPLAFGPAHDPSMLTSDAGTLGMTGGAGQEPLLGSAPWATIPLPSTVLAADVTQGGEPAGAHPPLWVWLPDIDGPDLSGVRVANEPIRSLETATGSSDFSAGIRAQASAIDAMPPQAIQALQAGAPERQDPPANLQVSGVLMYRLFNSPYPPVAGGANLNGLAPTPGLSTIHDGLLETAWNATFSPTFSLFADLSLENTTAADFSTSDIEEAYLDAHNLFGLPGLGIRLGRDRIKLGFTGLLLDETAFDGGRRDGIEMQLSQLGPVSVLGFMQYAVDDGLQIGNWTSTRRVWGARAEAEVVPGWTVNVSYRADTAGDVEVGMCPGIGCNVGNGFSAGIQGELTSGVNLIVEAATYTQSQDVARWYYEPSLAFDLQRLLGLPAQPVLTLWYKNFDPYTLPLDAPLGHLLTPSDFGIFNTNDNLTAVGARVDLSVTPAVSLFGLAEWGTYKDGGPNYNVYSIGVKYNLGADIVIKVTYNSYQVDGGIVTTSPVSGLQLSNAQIYELEATKSF